MAAPLDSGRLLVFATVAREGGFSRAARRLGKSQPAVSQAVAQLEDEVGCQLFERAGRGATLTERGLLLRAHAERIFDEMDRARAHLVAAGELRAGELSIGASDTLAYHLLPPVLAAFRQRYPRVELRLDNRPSPATAIAVAERRVQVGIVSLPLPSSLRAGDHPLAPQIHTESLARQPDVLIMPPDHPLVRRQRVTAAHLVPYPLVLLDRSTATRAYLERAFAELPVRPQVAMEMSSVEVLKRLVELGFGLSVIPRWAATREVAAGTLVARPLGGLGDPRSVGLVTPAIDPLPPATAAFVAIARAQLRVSREPRRANRPPRGAP